MEQQKEIKAQSKSQLAKKYNVSLKTLSSWIEPHAQKIGEYRGKSYTPKQVQIIYDILGHP